ncbi:macro domain-like protein [Aspergillus heteromorphus CBS 117.55]|uniref:Macro domain-like protein n=1 Tax=Aspergillus heteromorphus CBS 117.55 TaxID=1448321 RepID=A0A317W0P0_9EURO|nr:macro domain-like protein [Aspergillus heteromorphus CBS 117.55]PWY79181.1 macro domain-like protein [Aspergillus heteromorphus CBS 117.55]
MPSSIPHIHLLSMDPTFGTTLQAHLPPSSPISTTSPPFPTITIHPCALSSLPPTTTVTAIVSPANSHGRLDGGFDDAISRFFSPKDDYMALTRHAQAHLYRTWRGYLPPGHCDLIPIPGDFAARSKNTFGTKFLALCPTMRVPRDARWDREIVYNCVWSLLCAVERHNRVAGDGERIESLLMTPLATGCGGVSEERWARQFVLAIRHFELAGGAGEGDGGWEGLDLVQASEVAREVEETWAV